MVLTPPMGATLGGRVGVGVACGSPSVAFKEVRRGLGYEEAQGDLWMPPGTYRWFLPHLSWELGISVHAKMTMMLPSPLTWTPDGLPALPQEISALVCSAIEAAMQPRRKDRLHSVAEFLKLLENRAKSKDERGKSKEETLLNSSSTPRGEVSRSDGGESKLKPENKKSNLPLIIIILLLSVILGAGGYLLFSSGNETEKTTPDPLSLRSW